MFLKWMMIRPFDDENPYNRILRIVLTNNGKGGIIDIRNLIKKANFRRKEHG